MVRRVFFCCFLILLAFHSLVLKAQNTAGEFGLMKASWQIDKKIAIAKLMHFSEKQAIAFWPVYNQYMSTWCHVMRSRIASIMDNYDAYQNVTASSTVPVKDLFAHDVELNKLKKKTYKKVKKVLPMHKTKQFFQIEYTFQIVLSREVQERAMFIGYVTNKL